MVMSIIMIVFVIPFILTHGRDVIPTNEVFNEIRLDINAKAMRVLHKKLFTRLEVSIVTLRDKKEDILTTTKKISSCLTKVGSSCDTANHRISY